MRGSRSRSLSGWSEMLVLSATLVSPTNQTRGTLSGLDLDGVELTKLLTTRSNPFLSMAVAHWGMRALHPRSLGESFPLTRISMRLLRRPDHKDIKNKLVRSTRRNEEICSPASVQRHGSGA
ncbi:hypothetical protein OG21DRAFT_89585 [Imleria badia]|nr:hypothetical protein OG21DRAFT_89585 [Imleria badia]